MLQQDYILRLIETVGAALRRAMDLRRSGGDAEALELLDEAVRSLTRTSPDLVERLTPDGLVAFLGAGGDIEPLTGAALADTLDERALALAALGDKAHAAQAAAQAAAVRAALESVAAPADRPLADDE